MKDKIKKISIKKADVKDEMNSKVNDFNIGDIEEQMNKYGSLNNIEDIDFPCFYTVKKIVILIDGCLNIPFY